METDSNTIICPDGFTEDLMLEILKWLPVKSLFRFRCVCKSWKSLISSSNFIVSHGLSSGFDDDIRRSFLLVSDFPNGGGRLSYTFFDPRLSLSEQYPEFIPFPFGIRQPHEDWTKSPEVVKDVVHGVVCLSALQPRNNPIILWNPTIRKLVEVPPPPWVGGSSYWPSTALGFGFDGSKTSHCYDFKVVRIVASEHPIQYHRKPATYEVFSIREGGWKKVFAPHIEPFSMVTYSGCFANGSIHWVISIYNVKGYYETMLLVFDCEREEFKTIPFLRKFHRHRRPVREAKIFTYRGLLSVFVKEGYELWAMDEYGVASSWKKLRDIYRGDDFVRIECYDSYQYKRRGPPLPISRFESTGSLKKLWVDEPLMSHVLDESMFLMDVNGKAT